VLRVVRRRVVRRLVLALAGKVRSRRRAVRAGCLLEVRPLRGPVLELRRQGSHPELVDEDHRLRRLLAKALEEHRELARWRRYVRPANRRNEQQVARREEEVWGKQLRQRRFVVRRVHRRAARVPWASSDLERRVLRGRSAVQRRAVRVHRVHRVRREVRPWRGRAFLWRAL
jgi:hypothetical protein